MISSGQQIAPAHVATEQVQKLSRLGATFRTVHRLRATLQGGLKSLGLTLKTGVKFSVKFERAVGDSVLSWDRFQNQACDLTCTGATFHDGKTTMKSHAVTEAQLVLVHHFSALGGLTDDASFSGRICEFIAQERKRHSPAKRVPLRHLRAVGVNRPSSPNACAGAGIQPKWEGDSSTAAAAGVVCLPPVIIYANRGDFAQHGLPIYKKLVVRPSDAAKFCYREKLWIFQFSKFCFYITTRVTIDFQCHWGTFCVLFPGIWTDSEPISQSRTCWCIFSSGLHRPKATLSHARNVVSGR